VGARSHSLSLLCSPLFAGPFCAIALAYSVCSRLCASANRAHDHVRAGRAGTHRL